jgi:hypothetical protein
MARNGQQQGGGDKRDERAAGCGFVFHDAYSMKGTRNRTRPDTGIAPNRFVAPMRRLLRTHLTVSNTLPIWRIPPQLSGNDVPSRSVSIELEAVGS